MAVSLTELEVLWKQLEAHTHEDVKLIGRILRKAYEQCGYAGNSKAMVTIKEAVQKLHDLSDELS